MFERGTLSTEGFSKLQDFMLKLMADAEVRPPADGPPDTVCSRLYQS